jgi:hypothetical protein
VYLIIALGMEHIESNLDAHVFGVEHFPLGLIEEIQEKLLGVTTSNHIANYIPEIILEPSCFKNSSDFLLSFPTNHEHQRVLDNILCSYFLKEKDNNSY